MASQLEIQKRNLESSILFMQQEHAHTLRGLHEEISKLQKKCAELTFQLTMKSIPDSNADGDPGKLERMETTLHESELSRKKAELEAESSGRAARQARDQLLALEKQFIEEMKSKNQRIAVLTAELDTKGGTIAYLTTELHKVKAARRVRPTSASSGSELAQQQTQGASVEPVPQPPPLEPQRHATIRAGAAVHPQPPPPVQRALHRQLLLSDDGLGAPRRRPISGRRLVLGSAESSPFGDEAATDVDGISSPTAMPDPTPFLQQRQQQQREHSGDVVLKPTPPVLPPISSARRTSRAAIVTTTTAAAVTAAITPPAAAAAGGGSSSSQGRHHQRLVHGLRLDAAGTRAPVGEVGVLAVDRVPTTTGCAGAPYAQEPGSADCK